MNVLSKQFIDEVQVVMKKIVEDSQVKSGVLISGKPGCFIAGADIAYVFKPNKTPFY